jgi:hypothetical protein
MAKKKLFQFHGAFGTKKKAVACERKRRGAFIKKIKVNGQTRYAVVTRRSR